MKETGFTSTRVEHLVGPDSIVIGIKQVLTQKVPLQPRSALQSSASQNA
jgi:hypothetical protein